MFEHVTNASQISHHSCLFNDNCDGTLTVVGRYTQDQSDNHRPALVKSKNPLPENASPMMEPQPPTSRITAHQMELFLAGREKARSNTAPDSRKEKTVDEMMLESNLLALSSAETPGASETSGFSRTPPFSGAEQNSSEPERSSGINLDPPDGEGSGGEDPNHKLGPGKVRHEDASRPSRDATEENWRLVRKFLTGRQFYPPKRGHFAALLSSRRSRDVVTRPGVKFAADQPKKVRLLIVHMTGEEPSVPCDSCALSRGPFKKCVRVSQKAAGETTNGIVCCTNCAEKRSLQQSCNVEEMLSQPAVAKQRGSQSNQHKGRPVREPRDQANLGVSSQITKVDSHFTFVVHVLALDGSLQLDAEPSGVRLCSLTAGKVMVELGRNSPFLIGPHGMFKLMPAMSAQVSNASELDAVIHVSAVQI